MSIKDISKLVENLKALEIMKEELTGGNRQHKGRIKTRTKTKRNRRNAGRYL